MSFSDLFDSGFKKRNDDYKLILKEYKTHPINPPTSYDTRLERLYDLSRMVYADHIKDEHQVKLLNKIAVGLGFSTENVKYVVDKAWCRFRHLY